MPNRTAMEKIIDQQGWTVHTVLELATAFISGLSLTSEFVKYLQKRADLENAG